MAIALLAFSLAAVMDITTGCQTSDPVGRSLATTATTADAALDGWLNYAAITKAPESDHAKVKAAWEKYQAALRIARLAYTAAVPGQSAPDVAIAILEATRMDLLNLIASLEKQPAGKPLTN